ncbi:alanine racemase [Microbacter sp. GSS18]|nr:alanine racemase [Microbacter sp. GSS18]
MTTELVIDGEAFVANLEAIRARVAPAHHMLVVKDDAYGHGLAETAVRARAAGVGRFGAFDVRTGAAVRAALGDDVDVFVWIVGTQAEAEEAITAGLEIGVGDALLLEDVAAAAARCGLPARVHLKADTGLHRNGVRPEEWAPFVARAARLQRAGAIDVIGVWSHIAEASDAEDDAARSLFDDAVARVREAGLSPRLRHLAASAASFARPEFRYDMVRVGAFAYGIRPAGGPAAGDVGIIPIASLRAPVLRVAADHVVAAVGALHGIPSSLAGAVDVGTPAGPRRLTRIDAYESRIETWPGAGAGDVVTVFGPGRAGEPSATGLAEAVDTIGEEIAVRVSPGIPRRWR